MYFRYVCTVGDTPRCKTKNSHTVLSKASFITSYNFFFLLLANTKLTSHTLRSLQGWIYSLMSVYLIRAAQYVLFDKDGVIQFYVNTRQVSMSNGLLHSSVYHRLVGYGLNCTSYLAHTIFHRIDTNSSCYYRRTRT